MEIIPKLNLNRNPKDIPNNSIVAAKNMVVDDTGSYLTNEWGFGVAFECPNDGEFICGVVPTNKEFVIFTYCTTDKVSRIYRKTDVSSYEVNIGWKYSGGTLVGSYTYNYKGELIIALGEYDAVGPNGETIQIPYKCWNLDNTINVSHNQELEIPNYTFKYDIVNGNLTCAVYTFFIRYAVNDYDYTKWFQITPEIPIIQSIQKESPTHSYLHDDSVVTLSSEGFKDFNVNTNTISDKGINISITNNPSTNFTKYQIGYIVKRNEEVLGRIFNTFNINNKSVTFNNNEYIEEISIDDILKSPNQLYNVKNIINYNNRIYIANYEEYKNENLTPSNTNVQIGTSFTKVTHNKKIISATTHDIQISMNGTTTNTDNIAFRLYDLIDEGEYYKIGNVSAFVTNYIIKTIRLYNSLGEAKDIYSDANIQLTDEGKKIWNSCKESYSLVICKKGDKQNPSYAHVYNSSNHKVEYINWIKIRKSDSALLFNIAFNDGADTVNFSGNANGNYNGIFWNVYIYGTFYLKYTDTGVDIKKYGLNPEDWKGHYAGFIGENVWDPNVYTRVYPLGGSSPSYSIKNEENSIVLSGVLDEYYNTFIPKQKYNIYIHYIRKDNSYTNGYYVGNIYSDNSVSIGETFKPIIKFKFTVDKIPNGFIGYFFSYEDVDYSVSPIIVLDKSNSEQSGFKDFKVTNSRFIYDNEAITGSNMKALESQGNGSLNSETEKTYVRNQLNTPYINYKHVSEDANLFKSKSGIIYEDSNNEKEVKTLYRLTDNYYDVVENETSVNYIPNYYTREKVISFRDTTSDENLIECIINPTASYVTNKAGDKIAYKVKADCGYNYSKYLLAASSIKQDYNKGAVSLVSSTGKTLGVFYNSVISPDRLHDFLELKSAYISKPNKSFTNYNKDYIDNFNKTIRRSNVISDESLINGFRLFDTEQYRMIKENKGNITNIVGIGLYLLVHTEYSLFVFDRTPKLTQSSQLQIPDVFDIDYQEVLPANEGFGGLSNKEQSIISKNGYIWYDSVNKIIFKYENGKASVLSSDINNFIKDLSISTVVFGEDLITNRIIICIYVSVNNKDYPITISYNFNTNTFISLHDYSFTNCYRTYNKAYFFDRNKDRNRLYAFYESETGYKNLRNNDSLYYPLYENKNETSESKPLNPSPGTIIIVANVDKVETVSTYPSLINVDFRLLNVNVGISGRQYFSFYLGNSKTNEEIISYYDNTDGSPIITIRFKNTDFNKIYDYENNYLYYKSYFTKDDRAKDVNPAISNYIENSSSYNQSQLVEVEHQDDKDIINDKINISKLNGSLINPISVDWEDLDGNNIGGIKYLSIKDDLIITKTATNYNVIVNKGSKIIKVTHEDYTFKIPTVYRAENNIIFKNNTKVGHAPIKYEFYFIIDDDNEIDSGIVKTINNSTDDTELVITNKWTKGLKIYCYLDNKLIKTIKVITGTNLKSPIVRITDNKISIHTDDLDNDYKTYYTLDGTTPTNESNIYNEEIEFDVNKDIVIKAVNLWTPKQGLNIYSNISTYKYYVHLNDKTSLENIIYKTKVLTDNVIKNYVDIIYNINPEQAKSLESINYILNEFKVKFNSMNPAEQLLNRRFSGDSIILYTDETYTGAIDINDGGNTNNYNAYKLPTFQKGHWEFNYFRDNCANSLENGKFKALVFNKDKNEYELKEVTDKDITELYNKIHSDNKSLIYGKYIVARFIFNNDKRIKFEGITFITNTY